MIFNSVIFAIFFIVVFYLYWLVFRNNVRFRNIFLVIVSYAFYGWWDWRFLSLIIFSSIVDFIIGQRIYVEQNESKRKLLLRVSLMVNLGFLGFFKYFNFFVDSFIQTFSVFGITLNEVTLDIILPVGISFYTFQTLSYTIDIYYKKLEPTKDVFAFFAFVSFFPQLVAGPIERARNLLPQFFEEKKFEYSNFRSGLFLMAWGFFQKIVIADRLARYVDAAYSDVENLHGLPAFYAMLFFAFQLYLDFSAYSSIAIGCARLMGFDLSLNFRRPYLASSFSDFWKRWHITLSSWFRDYVYIPLGGNKVSNLKLYRNIFIVFLLSGLWHGASWNFVLWGGLNALYIVLFDRFFNSERSGFVQRLISSVFVSFMWAISLVLFRAQTFSDAITLYKNIFTESNKSIYNYKLVESEFLFLMAMLVLLMVVEIINERKEDLLEKFYNANTLLRWTVYLVLVLSIIFVGSYGEGLPASNFVYFQF